jgi:plasmid stabilization system protein ParE
VTAEYEICWSQSAIRDLDEILEYIAADRSVDQALKEYERIRRSIADLSRFPRRCRQVPELQDLGLVDFRELILHPYRIFFHMVDSKVFLIGVLDSRRDLEELLIQCALCIPDDLP